MARVRTGAGMSPGFRLPSRECTSTPSHTSIATLARYSCERCIGLRVWKAATRDPAKPLELGARFCRRHEERAVVRLEAAVGKYLDRPGQVHLALLHHHFHAGMLGVDSAEHGHALVLLVDPVFLGDGHGREGLAVVRIGQRDIAPGLDR